MGQMGAADRNGGGYSHQQGTSSAVDLSFDEVGRELAGGVSRRKALRLLGAALIGTALASVPRLGWAHHKPGHTGGGGQQRGNSACVRTCKAEELPSQGTGQCISAAARGGGCAPGNPCENVTFECPGPRTAGIQICLNVEGEAVVEEACCPLETTSGPTCVANECTGTVDCVCCPPGGPCPCLEFDETDPCTLVRAFCSP